MTEQNPRAIRSNLEVPQSNVPIIVGRVVAADYLGVNISTVSRWTARAHFPKDAIIHSKGRNYYDLAKLVVFFLDESKKKEAGKQ